MLSLNFTQIKNSKEPLTHIDCKVEMRKQFLERSQKLLYEIKNVVLKGVVFYNQPYVTGDFHVLADLVVPSSRSLKPVDLREDFNFSENYTDQNVHKEEIAESELPLVKVQNETIDLQTAVEDNILLHIPTTILTKKEKEQKVYPSGQGWSVISETEFNKQKKQRVNPAFAKLKSLLDEPDEQHDSGKKKS